MMVIAIPFFEGGLSLFRPVFVKYGRTTSRVAVTVCVHT